MKPIALLLSFAAGAFCVHAQFSVVEATIPEMRAAMEQHRVTSRELATQYLERIAFYEDKLHAAITVNRHALEEADQLDRERIGRTNCRFGSGSSPSQTRCRCR